MLQTKIKSPLAECLLVLLIVTSLSWILRYVNLHLPNHPLTQHLLEQVFSRALAAETSTPKTFSAYQATILEQSNSVLNLKPDKGFTITVRLLNSGQQAWELPSGKQADSYYLKSVSHASPIKHQFWLDDQTAAMVAQSVNPGEILSLKFAVQAPQAMGLYVERFGLTLGRHTLIPGSLFELPVNVTNYPSAQAPAQSSHIEISAESKIIRSTEQSISSADIELRPPESANLPAPATEMISQIFSPENIDLARLNVPDSEPIINVGLYYAPEKIITLTADGAFTAFSGDQKLGTYGAGTLVKVQYIDRVYNLRLPSGTASLSNPISFRPLNKTILELPDYDRPVSWNPTINDNRFTGSIEIKYNPATGRLWAINSLPLESYLAGVAETANIDVPEFHKVLAVAARSYALYHLLDNTRYNGFFHVDDHNDQIYRGINAANRLPYYVAGVAATKGQVITKNNQVVVAPYFTQSNGQTKSYTGVWGHAGLDTSHLISVPVPQDMGRELLGHGVGLSAQGAKRMAELDGMDYLTILKHFYTGVDISKVY